MSLRKPVLASTRFGGLIANAFGGDWDTANNGWRPAAEKWRDRWLDQLEPKRGIKIEDM